MGADPCHSPRDTSDVSKTESIIPPSIQLSAVLLALFFLKPGSSSTWGTVPDCSELVG